MRLRVYSSAEPAPDTDQGLILERLKDTVSPAARPSPSRVGLIVRRRSYTRALLCLRISQRGLGEMLGLGDLRRRLVRMGGLRAEVARGMAKPSFPPDA